MPVRAAPAAVLACTLASPARRPRRRSSSISPNLVPSRPACFCITSTSPTLVNPEGPISIWVLRLDPARVDLQAALANDEIMGTETVGGIAAASPAAGRDQRRLLSAQRRPGGRDDDRRATRERHAPAARRGGNLEGCDRRQARVRAAARHGLARAPEQQPAEQRWPGDGDDPDRRHRHDADSRSADALHAVVSRRHRHREGRTRVGHRPSAWPTRQRPSSWRQDADSAAGLRAIVRRRGDSRAAAPSWPEHSSAARCVVRSGRR